VPFFFKQWGEWIEGDQWHVSGHKFSDMPDRVYHNHEEIDFCHLFKVGKKKTGCLMDGIEWKQFPK
jgi:hypothetical protein